jgi:5-methylcytosine-specific restriction endonuclease McrA
VSKALEAIAGMKECDRAKVETAEAAREAEAIARAEAKERAAERSASAASRGSKAIRSKISRSDVLALDREQRSLCGKEWTGHGCGKKLPEHVQADHIISLQEWAKQQREGLFQGDANDRINLQLLCGNCHSKKSWGKNGDKSIVEKLESTDLNSGWQALLRHARTGSSPKNFSRKRARSAGAEPAAAASSPCAASETETMPATFDDFLADDA